jgi:hypothetical protein
MRPLEPAREPHAAIADSLRLSRLWTWRPRLRGRRPIRQAPRIAQRSMSPRSAVAVRVPSGVRTSKLLHRATGASRTDSSGNDISSARACRQPALGRCQGLRPSNAFRVASARTASASASTPPRESAQPRRGIASRRRSAKDSATAACRRRSTDGPWFCASPVAARARRPTAPARWRSDRGSARSNLHGQVRHGQRGASAPLHPPETTQHRTGPNRRSSSPVASSEAMTAP